MSDVSTNFAGKSAHQLFGFARENVVVFVGFHEMVQ